MLNLDICQILKIGYLMGHYFDKVSMLVSPNMSGPAPALPLVTVQVAVISTELNATMFLTFLCSSKCIPW